MRVLPSLTNSATTPSSRRFTSSMKAGGKDHSRPTSRPTFNFILQISFPFPSRSLARAYGAHLIHVVVSNLRFAQVRHNNMNVFARRSRASPPAGEGEVSEHQTRSYRQPYYATHIGVDAMHRARRGYLAGVVWKSFQAPWKVIGVKVEL